MLLLSVVVFLHDEFLELLENHPVAIPYIIKIKTINPNHVNLKPSPVDNIESYETAVAGGVVVAATEGAGVEAGAADITELI